MLRRPQFGCAGFAPLVINGDQQSSVEECQFTQTLRKNIEVEVRSLEYLVIRLESNLRSASIGVAEWHAPMTTDDLIKACDAALLRSKREGKGRVSRAGEPVR